MRLLPNGIAIIEGDIDWHMHLIADYETGTLTWRVRPRECFPTEGGCKRFNSQFAGKVAGTFDAYGYRQVNMVGRLYKAHRIIWEMANGPIPHGYEIDHVDRNPSNNSLGNLRIATSSQNKHNTGMRSNNKSGVKGVHFHKTKGKWFAQIEHNGERTSLGYFATIQEAAEARHTAVVNLHKDFAPNT